MNLKKLGNFWKIDKFLFLWGLCTIINIIAFLFIFFKIHPSNQLVSLKYNVLVGVEVFGTGKNLYLIPTAAALISLANFGLFRALKNRQIFYLHLVVFASLVVQIILLAAIFFLKTIN
jgi:hypothetical protein